MSRMRGGEADQGAQCGPRGVRKGESPLPPSWRGARCGGRIARDHRTKGKAKGVAHKLVTETGDHSAQCREGGGAQRKKVDRIVAGVGKEEELRTHGAADGAESLSKPRPVEVKRLSHAPRL